MAYTVGTPIVDYLDRSTAGRTFPTNRSLKPDGLTAFVPTIAAVIGDPARYRVTLTPDVVGTWLFDVTDSTGEAWSRTFDVEAVAGAAVVGSTLDPTDLGITLYAGDDVLPGYVWTLDGPPDALPNLATGTISLLIGRGDRRLVATLPGTAAGV